MPEDSTSSKPGTAQFVLDQFEQLLDARLDHIGQGPAAQLAARGGRPRRRHRGSPLTSASSAAHNRYLHLMSSASRVGVRSAMAMSLVIWSPAIGITEVWRIAPCVHTASSVVPPPISIRQTPEILFVLGEHGIAGGQRLQHQVIDLQAAAAHAFDDVLRRRTRRR